MHIGFPEILVLLGVLLLLLFLGLVILAFRRLGPKWPLLATILLVGWGLHMFGGLALPEIAAVLGLGVLAFWLVMWLLGRLGPKE
jgi:hypothetical protein